MARGEASEHSDADNCQIEGGSAAASNGAPLSKSLKSLAPEYDRAQHGTYLRHLEEQIKDPQNLNIALTGRYGTGKSSVLDEFARNHAVDTVRLSISTLESAAANAALTNRLQKEVVKQLLYQSDPSKLRLSRFHRISQRSPKVAFVESLAAVVAVICALSLPGWLPHLAGTGEGHPWLLGAVVWLAFMLLLSGLLTAARVYILDRREVTDLSAGGASVKLTTKNATYFDEYLDEIVYFFDQISPKYVIFEDLDRFEDPHIFEALRELNTLLNSTQRRRTKKTPVHFIYAIKDSLFEKLGADTREESGDAATAETKRANRTKFFEVVIPMVPFISHRNARELLADELTRCGAAEIDRKLVDIVARHATDMRLLHNMCNEFLVFAERLLESEKVAPGLTQAKLFALVAYKNFHLKDFELIARRESTLDTLYDKRRDLVADAIDQAQRGKRVQANARTRHQRMKPTATALGDRLTKLGTWVKARSSWASWNYIYFQVGGEPYDVAASKEYPFWAKVAQQQEIIVLASTYVSSNGNVILTLGEDDLKAWFAEALTAGQWDEVDARAVKDKMEAYDADIDFLRGADFADLAAESRFTLSLGDVSGGEDAEPTRVDFDGVIDSVLSSDLARQLVKAGFIDANYTLYAAQFYGHFSGIDVATFMVQNVNTNSMELNYTFSGPDSIQNLLEEAPSDFTGSIAAFNVEVLDYLFDNDPEKAGEVVEHLLAGNDIEREGTDAAAFLRGFLNSDRRPERLAAALAARGWRNVFGHLVTDETVPEDARALYVDRALVSVSTSMTYELSPVVRDFLAAEYAQMRSFTTEQTADRVKAIVGILLAARTLISDLAPLAAGMRTEVVARDLYDLTAHNLRRALETDGPIDIGAVRTNVPVYDYCLSQPGQYLRAVLSDDRTPHTVCTREALVAVLQDVDNWPVDHMRDLLKHAASQCRIDSLGDAPEATWPALAEARLFTASLANVARYVASAGSIDEPLGYLLTRAGSIQTSDTDEQATRMTVGIAVINSSSVVSEAATRAALVASLGLDTYIDSAAITTEPGDLLRLLREHDLVEDSHATFLAFKPWGWETLDKALSVSAKFAEFADANLLAGLAGQALQSSRVPASVKRRIVADVPSYVPDDEAPDLRAVADFALATGAALTQADVQRIAAVTEDASLTVRLIAQMGFTAEATVVILGHLPAPHSHIATRARSEFKLPDDDAHRTVLGVLDQSQLLEHRKLPMQSQRQVKLL